MKLNELRKVIREEVRSAIQEELKDILLEAVKSPKSVVSESVTSTPTIVGTIFLFFFVLLVCNTTLAIKESCDVSYI